MDFHQECSSRLSNKALSLRIGVSVHAEIVHYHAIHYPLTLLLLIRSYNKIY